MASITIPSDQWAKILQFLRDCPDVYVGDAAECQRFVEGVLWMDRSGAQWRLLPAEYGNWNTIYKRFARWCDRGVWELMHQHFSTEPDLEYLVIDSTVVRAHQCAGGAPAKRGAISASPRGLAGKPLAGFLPRNCQTLYSHIRQISIGNPLLIPHNYIDIRRTENCTLGKIGVSGPLSRPQSRRVQHEGSRERGRSGQPPAVHVDAGTTA